MNERSNQRRQRPSDAGPRRSKPGGSSAKKGTRIPPPPADRGPRRDDADVNASVQDDEQQDTTVFERIDKPKKNKKSGSKGPKKRAIDVSHVDMHGVGAGTASKLQRRLAEAASAFEAERFNDAQRMLESIERLSPGVPEVHELLGLTHYRMGRWIKATNELEKFGEMTGSVEQHPVMADCARALKRWKRAEDLWHELGEASPGPELIEEGRIVQAGALADQGKLSDAIRFMEKAPKVKGKPGLHHLRRWYVMGDLYERAGDRSRARRVFGDIARAEPDFGDAAERAASN